MQASLFNFILVQLQDKDVNGQRSQDLDGLIVFSQESRLPRFYRRVRRQMESVQKKHRILFPTDDLF